MTSTFARSEVFRQYFDSTALLAPIRSVVELLASDTFSSVSFDKLIATEVQPQNLNIQESLLDLTLVFAQKCVEDHRLSEAEVHELESLIAIFQINANDFRKLRNDAVSEIIYAQTVWILEDEFVTEKEEISQGSLQRLFGFSYDQYVSLLRPLAKQHIKQLESKRMFSDDPEELPLIDISIQNLRSVFLIRQ